MINKINSKNLKYIKELNPKDLQVKNFRKLQAYELGLQLVEITIKLINKFPKVEEYVLKDQLRRSIYGVAGQLSEGNGSLYIKKELHFVSIAMGSLCESQAWYDIALLNGYITKEEYKEVEDIATQIKALMVTYIRKLVEDCRNNKVS